MIDKASTKALMPANVDLIKKLTGLESNTPVFTKRSKDILAGLINSGAAEATTNINKVLMCQGLKASNVIRIQDLVRQTNANTLGAGLRLA